ncbi:hypothetical protein Lal_00047600, partial [Lupinus albus]
EKREDEHRTTGVVSGGGSGTMALANFINSTTHWAIWGNKSPTLFTSHKVFCAGVEKLCEFTTCQFPQPCLKGDVIAIKIPEEEYQVGLQRCKIHLHGRLILSKGDNLMKFTYLKAKLTNLWSMIGK